MPVVAALACAVATAAAALPVAPVADPTRPPTSGNATTAAGAPPAVHTQVVVAPVPAPQLQSIQLSAQNGDTVLIDGQLARAGDQIAHWRVMSIDARGVVLRGVTGVRRLTLLPDGAISARTAAVSSARPGLTASSKEFP